MCTALLTGRPTSRAMPDDENDDGIISDSDDESPGPAYIEHNGGFWSVPLSDGSTAGRVRDHEVPIRVCDALTLSNMHLPESWPDVSDIPPMAIVVVLAARYSDDVIDVDAGPFTWYCRVAIESNPRGPDSHILRPVPRSVRDAYTRHLLSRPYMRTSSLFTRFQPPDDDATPDPELNNFVVAPGVRSLAFSRPLQRRWCVGDGDPSPVKRIRAAVESSFEHLFCPITHELPVDPVFARDGIVYERAAISQWFETSSTSPKTNLPIGTDVVAAPQIKSTIEALAVGGTIPFAAASAWKVKAARLKAEQGDAAAACALARWHESGAWGLQRSKCAANALLKRCADAGSGEAAGLLARLMYTDVAHRTKGETLLYAGAGAALGSSDAKSVLASVLTDNKSGVPLDWPRARRLMEEIRAAGHLNHYGLVLLARDYCDARFGPVDREKAVAALRDATLLGGPSGGLREVARGLLLKTAASRDFTVFFKPRRLLSMIVSRT